MENTEKLFNELFKFETNQEVRHRGDTKGGIADMGLLILNRQISESIDDDGNKIYERLYICRMVRYSGSGEVNKFYERELMTTEEYNRLSANQEAERNQMRTEIRQIQEEVYKAFGVDQFSEMHLIKNGKIDKDSIYKPSGFSLGEKGTKLKIRKVAGLNYDEDKREEVGSRKEFEIIEKPHKD